MTDHPVDTVARHSLHEIPTPLYHQIQLVLRERIEQGYYGRSGNLPSEQDLSREFDVSRITVSRAIRELVSQGLVQRRRGAGTRVIPQNIPGPISADIDDLIETLNEIGESTEVRVLEFGFVMPSPDVQSELQVGPNEIVQRAVRVRSSKGAPFSYLTSYIPGDIGKAFDESDLAVSSLMRLLEKNGVKIGSARQSFSAALADPQVGAALDLPVGSPLLALTRTVYGRDGAPVEYLRSLYRPDRYQYRMTMEREKAGGEQWSTMDQDLTVIQGKKRKN